VATAFDFLTGGVGADRSTPVLLAKGVASTMFARKVMHLMAAAAAGLIGFGVVLAGDTPDPPAPPRATTAPPTAPVTGALPRRKVEPPPRAGDAAEPCILITAMCMEVPADFCEQTGLAGDDSPTDGAWILSRRETRMFTALIRAQKEKGEIDILTRPHMMVLDGQSGFAQIGQEVPVATQQAETKDGKTVNTSRLDSIHVGVALRVTPRISADGKYINLQVGTSHTAMSETPVRPGVTAAKKGGEPATRPGFVETPVFNVQSLQTTAVLPDGGTLVARSGAVTRTAVVQDRAGRREREKRTHELLWVLTAHVVRGDAKVAPPVPATPPPVPVAPAAASPVGPAPTLPPVPATTPPVPVTPPVLPSRP
jgi:hypothetical protein